MKSLVLYIFCLALPIVTFSEEIYSPDINGLFDATLIVTGKAEIKNGQVIFTIHNVLKNVSGESYNSKSIIRFQGPRYGILSILNPQINSDVLIVYLKKYKGAWYCYGGSQQVHALKNQKIPFDFCQEIYWLTPGEYLRMKKQFFTAFRRTGDGRYHAFMTQKEFLKSPQTSPIVNRFYTCNPWGTYMEEPGGGGGIDAPVSKPEPLEDTTIYSFLSEDPTYPGGMTAFMKFVQSEWRNVELNELEKEYQGRIYFLVVVEKDGRVSKIEVARGISVSIDKKALRIMRKMPNWKPGSVRGKVVRSQFHLPFPVPEYH